MFFKRDWQLIDTRMVPDLKEMAAAGCTHVKGFQPTLVQTFKCKITNKVKVVRTYPDWPYESVTVL